MNASPRLAGFSLLELLAVVVLMLILTVVSMGPFTTSSRRRALLNCQNNLQKIYLALSIYKTDNGAFPYINGATNPAQPLSLLIPKCTTMTEIFICPGSKDKALPEAESFAQKKISYAYYMGRTTNDDPSAVIASDAQVDDAPKNSGQALFSADGKKPGNNHGKLGGNLVSCGGEIITSGPRAARDFRFPSAVRLLNP